MGNLFVDLALNSGNASLAQTVQSQVTSLAGNLVNAAVSGLTTQGQAGSQALDRRVRLRPKPGAAGAYYGSTFNSTDATASRQSALQTALSGADLPWLSNKPLSSQAPNTPSYASSGPAVYTTDQLNTVMPAAGIAASSLPWLNGTSSITNTGGGSNVNLMAPLALTNGMVFPYTPSLEVSNSTDYASYEPVHSIQQQLAFTRSKSPSINISGRFTAQNQAEAQYALAAIHFCRTAGKMAFGQSMNPGTPPPVLLLDAYGTYAFNAVPVILMSTGMTWPDDVDFVQVLTLNTWVPAVFTLSMSLTVQHTPQQARNFSLEKFRSGELLKSGWI